MKKTVLLSLVAVGALNAESITEAFASGKANGHIRTAYINNNYDAGGNDYATAIGGELKYETAPWNDFKLGIGAYVSQKIGFATGDNTTTNGDFFDENKKSYAYVGEAYLDYSAGDLTLRVGRQLLDTPLADTDDIRMNPNTFEAAIATYTPMEGTTLLGGYMTRWAGVDSGEDKSTFKKLGGVESRGAAVAAIMSERIENLSMQGWYYGIDRVADIVYGDATYTMAFSETAGGELTAQYATFNEEDASAVEGQVYGLGLTLNVGAITLGAAYNRASNAEGKAVVNGYGGGPYFTSMEEWTIEGMEDAKAYQFSTEIDMGFALEGMSLTVFYGLFKSAPLATKIKEWDVILAYTLSDTFNLEASYARVSDSYDNGESGADAGYSRFLTRLNYNF